MNKVTYNKGIIHIAAETATGVDQEQARAILREVWNETMNKMAAATAAVEQRIFQTTFEPTNCWPATLRFVTDERDRATHLSG